MSVVNGKQVYRQPLYYTAFVTLILITGGLCALYAATAVAAEPEALGSISGVVRDRNGTPVGDIELTLSGQSTIGSVAQSVTTDSTGHYRFSLLPTGLYRLTISDEAERYPTPQYYEDAISLQDATAIAVNGDDRTGIDIVLQSGGEIRGRVMSEDGTALANVAVNVYSHTDSRPQSQQGLSTVDGRYVITGLASGFYFLKFTDGNQLHYSKFYADSSSRYGAVPIGVSAGGQVDEINIQLERGSTLQGQVIGSDGPPIANVLVEVRTRFGSIRASGTTGENGTYTVGGLDAGNYLLSFTDPSGRYRPSSYSNVENIDGLVIGEKENLTGLNITLALGGIVEGRVTDEEGNPLADAHVRATPRNSTARPRSAQTDAQGIYQLDGLSLDLHTLEFSNPGSLYISEYYSNVTTLAASTPITVFLGDVLTDVNASLSLGGAITGTIATVDDSPLGRVTVSAIPQNRPVTETLSLITTVVGSRLTYTLGGLPAEPYLVSVRGLGLIEYYNNVGAEERATAVQVTTGGWTRDINFVLGDGADAATMSGTVRTPDGDPRAGVNVSVYCEDPCGRLPAVSPIEEVPAEPAQATGADPIWNYLRAITTDDAGHYQIAGLQPRRYRLRFTPRLYDTENRYTFHYYQNALDLASATDIELQPSMVRADLDATLITGGAITGVVMLGDDNPLHNGELTFYFWDGYHWVNIATAAINSLTGTYTRPALQSGRYRVEASVAFGRERYSYFYGNTTVLTAAQDVGVTAGLTTTDINITLPPDVFLNAAITGTVTAGDKPLPNVRVELFPYSGSNPIIYTTTDGDGRYALRNLGESIYFVAFTEPTGAYAIGYSHAITTFDRSIHDAIFLDANTIMTDVNGTLTAGGTIQGQVLDGLGHGVGQVEIDLYTLVGMRWMQATPTVQSDENGFYRTPGLLPGHYRLYFHDPLFRYSARYYGDSSIRELSPDIEVQIGEATKGINVVMTTSSPRTLRVYLPLITR